MDFLSAHPDNAIWVLLGYAIFPRITMFFLIDPFTSLLSVLGFIFLPHVMVAVIATTLYWDTDPFLCVLAWIIALGGSGTETKVVTKVRVKRTDV